MMRAQGIPSPGIAPLGVAARGSVNYDFTTASLPAGITFTRTTTATYFDSGGVMQTAAINTARFNYVGGVACLLIEPAATNLIPYSNAFSSGSWFSMNS